MSPEEVRAAMKERKKRPVVRGILPGIGLSELGNIAAGIGSAYLANNVLRDSQESTYGYYDVEQSQHSTGHKRDHLGLPIFSSPDVRGAQLARQDLERKMAPLIKRDLPGVRMAHLSDVGDARGAPHWNPLTMRLHTPTTLPEVAGHEMGHALNHKSLSSVLGDDVAGLAQGASNIAGGLAPFGGLASYLFGGETGRDYAWAVPLLMAAPRFADETLAHIRGWTNYSKDLGYNENSLGNAARALSTYALAAGLPALGLYAANKLRRKKKKRLDEKYDEEQARYEENVRILQQRAQDKSWNKVAVTWLEDRIQV